MNILQLPLSEVHPYKNNPRKNDKAVDAVAESIKQYGFLVPRSLPVTRDTGPRKSWALPLSPAFWPTS